MEKQAQAKPKIKILKFLPKAANSAVTFTNPSYSPGREKRFSGPIISIIPIEARRKTNYGTGFDTPQEPTSPKISCMGQIKHKKKMHKKKLFASKILQQTAGKPPKPAAKFSSSSSSSKIQEPIKPKLADAAASRSSSSKELKKQTSVLSKIFHHGAKLKPEGRKSDASSVDKPKMMTDRAPSLSQMNRFASGRDAFVGFDWTTVHQIAPVDSDHHRNFYSDDEESGDSEGEEDIIIPFSAPILMGSGGHGGGGCVTLEPRKEINLWKRRTMAPPRPLQLNVRSK